MRTLEHLFLDGLADIYSAEKELSRALPELAKCARRDSLHEALESHAKQTEDHVRKLE